jgi:transcriptional regulator with XRE-family HTH domain
MASPVLVSLNAGMKLARPPAKKRQFRRTHIREWRKYRDLTLEALAERVDMTASHFSMLERGQRGYTQETLEAIAEALQTSVGSLLTRNPLDDSADWSIWDQAKPGERKLALELLKTVRKTSS